MNELDPAIITLIGGQILTVIAAIAAAVVAVINALRMKDLKERQDVNIDRINTVAKDTEAIKGHVNSEKTAQDGRIALLENENKLLKEVVQEKKVTASLLAQAVALRSRETGVAMPAAVAEVVDDTLKAIESNTAETAANTKKDDGK